MNPYAAPQQATPDMVLLEPRYWQRSWLSAVLLAACCGLAAGGVISTCLWVNYSRNVSQPGPGFWQGVLAIVALATPGMLTVAAFGCSWKLSDIRRTLFAIACYALVVAAVTVVGMTTRRVVLFTALLPASQMLVLATICWLRQIPVPFIRVMLLGLVSYVCLVGLMAVANGVILPSALPPYGDYWAMTSVGVFWCWSIALVLPFVIRQPQVAASIEGAPAAAAV